jgi:hypothetical protein
VGVKKLFHAGELQKVDYACPTYERIGNFRCNAEEPSLSCQDPFRDQVFFHGEMSELEHRGRLHHVHQARTSGENVSWFWVSFVGVKSGIVIQSDGKNVDNFFQCYWARAESEPPQHLQDIVAI